MPNVAERRTGGFLRRTDHRPLQQPWSAEKCGPHAHSLVKLNLLGDKRPALRQNFSRNGLLCRDAREGHDRRIRFKSRAGQLKIGDALLKLHAYGAPVAAAIVIGFMSEIRRRKNLESEQKSDPNGGKELP